MNHPVGGRGDARSSSAATTPDVAGKDRREVLAKWLASPENPYFATNLANLVWAHFFGRGIVEPVDDVRVSNPPSNPELLEALGKQFTDYKYDFKQLVRDICNSRTYQLSDRNQRHQRAATSGTSPTPPIRRIRAEVLLDCISQVDRDQGQVPGPAARLAGRADRRRQHERLLPDHLRPGHPRDGLLVRSEDGADPLAGAAPAQRRHASRARSATAG